MIHPKLTRPTQSLPMSTNKSVGPLSCLHSTIRLAYNPLIQVVHSWAVSRLVRLPFFAIICHCIRLVYGYALRENKTTLLFLSLMANGW